MPIGRIHMGSLWKRERNRIHSRSKRGGGALTYVHHWRGGVVSDTFESPEEEESVRFFRGERINPE